MSAWVRRMDLRTQLALAFVGVVLLAVVLSGLWAREIQARQSALFLRRVEQGDLPPRPGPVGAPAGVPFGPRASRFAQARLAFLRDLNRSLLLGGGTAALAGILLGVILAQRIARPVRQARDAATGIASGDYARRLPVGGPGELAALAEAFNAMAARLEADQRLRREFLAAVAHELRTPLAIIQANLESFLDGVDAPSPERLTVLHAQAELLGRLITDLRDSTLAEAGQLVLRRRPTDLGALWRGTVETMQPWIDERDVRVAMRQTGEPVADVDPDRMRQVIQNLLHNMIRHSPRGGVVQAALTRDGDTLEMVVEDEGSGIPAEDLPRIFEAFYRSAPSRARGTGGTGLGLAVVRHLVAAHGGSVHAENRPGGGSRFVVRIPVAADVSRRAPIGDEGAGA